MSRYQYDRVDKTNSGWKECVSNYGPRQRSPSDETEKSFCAQPRALFKY
jgi:hypothetical protein